MPNLDDCLLKFEVPEIIHGAGSLSVVGECARRLGGERVLLVTDPGVIKAGWLDETIKYLEKEDLKYVLYDNVVSNPRDFQVEIGVDLYLKKKCDVIVALGGGSPIDTAKGIGILASNNGRIYDYEGCNLITQPVPPMVCLPTTAGTGADVSQFAIVTDTRRSMKMTILSRAIMPDISIIDPRFLLTLPEELIASTGMDALTHAIEAYVSSLSWPLTDPHSIHAVKLASGNLVRAAQTRDLNALSGMTVASLEAGIAFSNAILGAVHALAHPLGGMYDLHHGLINSILLPVVVRQNMEHAQDKFANVARAMGVKSRGMDVKDLASEVPEKISRLIEELGLPDRLSQLGVKKEDIPTLAQMAKEEVCMLTNPYHYSVAEIEKIYREVW
ncbi:MAG: iron-containing alcohol dehydrogenase [Deltaproteobacteria bacterium]|nr:iron-containing alcohol dehydrogenase [Deltaproteobacteria bacterium]